MLFSKSGGVTKIIVFLGNPGNKYANTRHNVGFMTADSLANQEHLKINRLRFNALTSVYKIGNEKVLLMKPQTYMNLSGNSVAPAISYYKIAPKDVIVVCDDVSLPVGKIRIRKKGSSGGHNGLKSVQAALSTSEYPRLKIGVGAPSPTVDSDDAMINHVIGNFTKEESSIIEKSCNTAIDAIFTIINEGTDKAMNQFN